MKILVTGATGFIGKRVVSQLLSGKHEVHILTRNIAKGVLNLGSECKYFLWNDTTQVPPLEAFEGVDAIINLMGEGIAEKRWSKEQKQKIYDSRIGATSSLIKALKSLAIRPKVLVSGSAIGIYGNRGDEEILEHASLADDFLATVCKEWEAQAKLAEGLGLRVVIIRTGVVLGRDGGALKKMLPIFKLGGGGPVGSGKQFMSWIHVDDIASMFVEAAKNSNMVGVLNGTAPYPVRSKEFAKELGKVLGRPAFAPAPAFALKIVFGEMSQVLLDGQKVIPAKFQEHQFKFKFPTLDLALKDCTKN